MSPKDPKQQPNGPGFSKAEIRARARELRSRLAHKERRSQAIWERLSSLPQFEEATVLLAYMHIRSEVRTAGFLGQLLETDKQLVLPYCAGNNLELYRVSDLNELAPGTYGILEPSESMRSDPGRRVQPHELDLLGVPGVAFDRAGGRVGHGAGYYDRLLTQIRPDAWSVGLAFECQLFDRVPMSDHDVPLRMIVTEETVYRCC